MNQRAFGIMVFCLILAIAFYLGWRSSQSDEARMDGQVDSGIDRVRYDQMDESLSTVSQSGVLLREQLKAIAAESDSEQSSELPIPGQAILQAEDEEAYRRILSEAALNGAQVKRQLDALRAVQLKITDTGKFAEWVARNGYEFSANYFVHSPPAPQVEPESLEAYSATGNSLVQWLGLDGLSGAGVKVAVLDSGISEHPTFAASEIIRTEDGVSVYENGHGTAVASLIAGSHPQAMGVAPETILLDFPVIDENGIGDTFLLAEKIIEAADSGARVMNLSLGATGDSALVRQAISYAQSQDVIIVAAAGNEGVGQLTLPAYLPGVVAVGAVDAEGQILPFSNRGEGLDVVAPGYEVQAAWPDQRLVQMTGTSGAVPIVTGALATLLAREPDLSSQEAVTILQQYSNEAGTLGLDPNYGYGVLDLNRMLNRNARGIYDAAVVSQYPDIANLGHMNVLVQNQGTETLYGIHVKTVSNGVPSSQYIQQLLPGEVLVRSQRISSQARSELKVTTQISGGFSDIDNTNDMLESVLMPDSN
ncbi:MAG: S8 family serine peptidase [Verrucomicrobiota bacterium]